MEARIGRSRAGCVGDSDTGIAQLEIALQVEKLKLNPVRNTAYNRLSAQSLYAFLVR